MPQSSHPDASHHRRGLDDVLGAIDGLIEGDELIRDAMRWKPADNPNTVRGLLIPDDDHQPMRVLDLTFNAEDSLLPALVSHLGNPVAVAITLSTVEFIVPGSSQYTTDSSRSPRVNERATAARLGLWGAVASGAYAASDAELAYVRLMLAKSPLHAVLFGPAIVLGVHTPTGKWTSTPKNLINAWLAFDHFRRLL